MKPSNRLGVPGTGPYMIASHGPTQIVLVRNPYFREWSAAAQPDGYPDRIVWNLVGTPGQQLTAVEQGKADYVPLVELPGGTSSRRGTPRRFTSSRPRACMGSS